MVPQRKDITIESVRIKEVEKIVEKIVKLTGEEGDEEGCISQAGFVNVWNNLMHIPYSGNDITEDCIDEDTFMNMVSKNITQNFKRFQNKKYETYKEE